MNNAERLSSARDELERAAARVESGEGVDVAALREAINTALTVTEQFVGECQEETPFAPTFLVMDNGKAVWKCSHDSPHVVSA